MTNDNRFELSHDGLHNNKVSLETTFMGIPLSSPFIAGACPLTTNCETNRQLADAGIGAIVLPSILQEQLDCHSAQTNRPNPATSTSVDIPQLDGYNGGAAKYLQTIELMKSSLPVPIIASIHGENGGEWLNYVIKLQDSGADGLEINWQIGRCDPNESGEQIESRLLAWVARIRELVSIPIAVKLNAKFTNPASVALKLQNTGVNALVLFSHRPHWDVDIDRMSWSIGWELSPITLLSQTLQGMVETCTPELTIDVAANGGVRTGDDAIKTMIAGADVSMVVSEIYRQGPEIVCDLLADMQRLLNTNRYPSLKAFRKSRPNFDERAGHSMRSEIIDPLTRSLDYHDPTPVARRISGDCFGHPSH